MRILHTTYTAVSEATAKAAKEMNSYSRYKEGTATGEQNYYVNKIVEYANNLLVKNDVTDGEKIEAVQAYIDRYSKKIAEAIDSINAIDSRCPSILITGGGNFPVRKKEKQNQARESHHQKYGDLYKTDSTNYYYKKIKNVICGSGIIKSDDKNAVEKIKRKIAALEPYPDPYGNKKAEIRRLKERLLVLSPEEVKDGKEITINGIPATFESIVAIFDGIVPKKSQWDENDKFYLPMVKLVFSDGKRKYTEFLSNEVNADCTQLSTHGNSANNYQTIWKPLDNTTKFYLVINKISGSGNKAVIHSVLKDLDPLKIKAKEPQETAPSTATINGENVTIERNIGAMRLQVFFDGIPSQETRAKLKSNGFKWAPSVKAWQRLLNSNAEYALKSIIDNVT